MLPFKVEDGALRKQAQAHYTLLCTLLMGIRYRQKLFDARIGQLCPPITLLSAWLAQHQQQLQQQQQTELEMVVVVEINVSTICQPSCSY